MFLSKNNLNVSEMIKVITEFKSSKNYDNLHLNIFSVCKLLSIDHFRLDYISSGENKKIQQVTLSSTSHVWKDLSNKVNHPLPFILKGMQQSTPVFWQNIITECCDNQNKDALDAFLLVHKAGLVDGMTIPCHHISGDILLLSLINSSQAGEEYWLTMSPILLWLSTYILEAIRKIT